MRRLPPHRAPPDLLDRAMHRATLPPGPPPRWSGVSAGVGVLVGVGGVLAVQLLDAFPSLPEPRDREAAAETSRAPSLPTAAVLAPSAARQVRFVVHAPGAAEVRVAGSWTGWSVDQVVLHRGAGDYFSSTVDIPAGEHEYQLVVDGRWLADPAAPLSRDDGFGRRNSVLVL